METHLKILNSLVDLLENKFNFLGFRFGIDPLLGLIPGVGDFISLFISAYSIWIAKEMKLPGELISKMIGNLIFDATLGLIPVFGDAADFIYKANTKNLRILKQHLNSTIEGEVVSQ